MIASVPEHPLLEQALEQVNPMDMYWTGRSERLKEVAGPRLLERLVPDHPNIKLLEPPLCFPATREEMESAITVHHMARTWHNETTLRSAMLRAEKRLETTKAQLAAEKRAYTATRKRSRSSRRAAKSGLPAVMSTPARSTSRNRWSRQRDRSGEVCSARSAGPRRRFDRRSFGHSLVGGEKARPGWRPGVGAPRP